MSEINSKLLEDFMKENNLTKRQLAERCGISVNKLERFMAGKSIRRPLTTIYNISFTTKIKVDDLLYISNKKEA